jgi:hypothetical protein
MLIIGFNSNDNSTYSHELDVEVDIDSPRRIHDLLKKKANNQDFTTIVCVVEDAVAAVYVSDEDFDLSAPAEEDENSSNDDEDDSDDDSGEPDLD